MYTNKIITLLSVVVMMASCVEGTQEREVEIDTPQEVKKENKKTPEYADVRFKDRMVESAFQYYLTIKMALVHADSESAKDAAANLAEDLTEKYSEMKKTALLLSEEDDIEKQRQLFEKLSLQMEPLLKESITGGEIYKQYCPMAFDNKGAYWLSESSEIKNPYFGEKMLKCGSTKETIRKNK